MQYDFSWEMSIGHMGAQPHMPTPSNKPTRYASAASWSACTAEVWKRRPSLYRSAISRVRRWNGARRRSGGSPRGLGLEQLEIAILPVADEVFVPPFRDAFISDFGVMISCLYHEGVHWVGTRAVCVLWKGFEFQRGDGRHPIKMAPVYFMGHSRFHNFHMTELAQTHFFPQTEASFSVYLAPQGWGWE